MIKNRDFIILLIGRFLANFGDSFYLIATMSFLFQYTGSSFYTGIALFLTSMMAIFQVLLSPILDRVPMKKFLVCSQCIQGVLLLIIPYLHRMGSLKVYHILIVIPVLSLANQLVYPGQLALLPKIVEQKDLVKANSLFSIAYQGSDAIFNGLSGYLFAFVGICFAYYINSIIFFITAIMFMMLSSRIQEKEKKESTISWNRHWNDLKLGLILWKKPILKELLIGVIFINFSATAIFAILPEYSVNNGYYGILLSATGIGVFIGSIVANTECMKKIQLGKLYPVCVLITAIFWASISMITIEGICGKVFVFLVFLVGWICVGILNIYSQTIVQTIVSKEKMGVALSAMIGLSVAFAPIGALLSGVLSRFYNTRMIILLMVSLIFIIGCYWAMNGNIRSMETIEKVGIK